MVASAVVGSAVVGGVMQSSAASKAAKAQTNAANSSIAAQREFFNVSQENLKPFINTGTAAGKKIADLQGLEGGDSSSIMSTLEGLPGYQFAKTQGLKATQNSATARGLGISGAAQKGAADYTTGLANQYYNNLLSGLQTTQQTGANAAAGLANNATATGQGVGEALIGAGNARGAADIARGNAISNAAGGIPTALLTNQLFKDQPGSSGIYGNINNDGSISNSFDDANDLYGNAAVY